jgi:tetratricopeptide (TPR) repeat protein
MSENNMSHVENSSHSSEATGLSTNSQSSEERLYSKTNRGRVFSLFGKFEPLATVVSLIISGVIGFFGASQSIDTKIKEAFTDKLGPYENLQAGKALVDDFEYDAAIADLEKAFKKLGARFSQDDVNSQKYYPIVDYYLSAIVNSSDPSSNKHHFEEILKIGDGNKFSFNAWHFQQFGSYYMRIGDLEKAEKNFNEAISGYGVKGLPVWAADAHWGLALVHLCKGEMDLALENYEEAYKIKSFYAPESVLRTIDLERMKNDNWYKPLIHHYHIEKRLPEFANRIRKVNHSGEVISGSDPEGLSTGFGK